VHTLRKLRLAQRFTLLITLCALGLLGFAALAMTTLDTLRVGGPVYRHIVQGKDLIADVLPPPEYIIESYLTTLQLADPAFQRERDELLIRLRSLREEYIQGHTRWQQEQLEEELSALMSTHTYEPAMAFYRVAFEQLAPALQAGDKDGVAYAMRALKTHFTAHRDAILRTVQVAGERHEIDERQADAKVKQAKMLLAAILLAVIGASVGGAIVISRSVTRPIQEAVRVAEVVAAGDLRSEFRTGYDDEAGRLMLALQRMNGNLATIVQGLRGDAETVVLNANEIAEGSQELSARTETQAGSLEETASAMEEFTAAVRQNAEHAAQASRLAASASDIAGRGGRAVSSVVRTMGAIRDCSRKVADIVGVIDSIAFQTNILALNASVEAARAGAQGRGFAVVASEVRTLAQRAATAAKEIRALIDDSVAQIDTGSTLADGAGATMAQIVEAVQGVAAIMQEIREASHEQSAGIEQINESVLVMDEMTQKNAMLAQESAAAAQGMQETAQAFARSVAIFKVGGDGQATETIGRIGSPSSRAHAVRRSRAGGQGGIAVPYYLS
jgi:methyl-accepting chemotaxis protein